MRTIGDQLALAGTITAQLDLTGDARHRHIPGSPYEWRHGWIPLTRAAAMSHFHGHVPSSWHPASEAGRLSAPGKHEETVKAGRMGEPSAGKAGASKQAKATPLRHTDLIEYDAMVTALRALSTERLQNMLRQAEEHPHEKGRWDSLMAAGVRMIADPNLIREELSQRTRTTGSPARETAPEHAAVSAAAGRMRDAIKTAAAKDESIPSWERHDKAVSGEVPAAMSALDALERASSGGDVQAIGKAMQSVDDSISRGMHSDGRLGMDGSVKAARNALAEAVVSRQGGIALGDISPSARHVVIEDPLSGLKSYNDLRDPESLRSYAQQAAVRGLKISEASGPPDLSGVPKSGQQLYKHAVTHGWNASLHVDHDSGGKPIYTVVAANPETRQTSTQSFVQGKRSTYNAEPVSASLDRITQNPRGKYAAAADVPAARASADARALASDMRKTSRTGSPEHTAAKALAGAVRDIGAGRDPGSAVRDVRDLLAKNLAGAQAEREQMLADQARGKYVMLGDVGQRIERTQGLLKRAEALHAATAKAPAAQAAAPSAPAHTDFMSDAERQAAEAKYAKVMKAPGSPRYVAQAEHEMKQGRYGNAIGLMERADTLESNEGVGPSGPSRRAIVATITGLRAKQAEHIRAQRAKEAPAPAPTISEQLAMFGERTTSGKDVTSGAEGTLAPGDWHAGYQAIGAAPLDALPSERSRQVDHPSSKYGVNVKGAWSDPVWVAKPGGGFAISARWKSKAQKVSVYGGGPARTVDHPAHDERVIIPVDAQGRTAKQSAEQELKAEQARQAKAAADKAEAARKADAARVERQAAAEQKSIERNNRLVAEQRARNEQEAARKAAGAQTAQDRGLTEGARVFVDSGKFKGGIATVRSVDPDGRTMVEHYGGDLETMAPDHLRTQPSGAEETRRMNAVHEADKAKQQMAEQAKREAEAAERNSRGMDRRMARSAAGRQHFQEVTGFPFPQQERFAPDITEAEGLLSRGKLAEGAAALDRAIAAHEASRRGRVTKADQARVDRVRKLRDKVAAAAANPRPTLPALAKVHGTNRKGSFTALDHAGNEYKIGLDPATKQVSVTRDGKTLTAPAGDDPTYMARLLAGNLAGTGPVLGTASSGSPVRAGDRVATNVRFGMGRGTLEGTVQGGKGIVMGATPDGKLRILADDGKRLITAKPSEVVRAKNQAEGGDSGPAFGTIGQQLAAREPAKPAGRDYVVTAEKNPPGKGAVTGLRRMTLAEARQSQFASSRASSRRHVVHADTLAPDTGAVDSVQAASSARYSSPEVRDQVGRAVAAYTYGNYEDARASAAAALQSETNAAARAAISRLVRVIEEDRAQAVSA